MNLEDRVHELELALKRLTVQINTSKQTQEPERKEEDSWKCRFCGHDKCWFDREIDEDGNMNTRCEKCGKSTTEKEPKCEHEWMHKFWGSFNTGSKHDRHDRFQCKLCGVDLYIPYEIRDYYKEEKPAKKECEHEWDWMPIKGGVYQCRHCGIDKPVQKDELAERLEESAKGRTADWNRVADEARKWAVELAKKYFQDEMKLPSMASMLCDELVERLRGEK